MHMGGPHHDQDRDAGNMGLNYKSTEPSMDFQGTQGASCYSAIAVNFGLLGLRDYIALEWICLGHNEKVRVGV